MFHFLKVLFFGVVRKVKGQKIAQNDKKLSVRCTLSQEPCITWSSFMVHVWKKDNISRCFYNLFQVLIFSVNSGLKGEKLTQNDKKLYLLHSILRNQTSHHHDFWYTCVKWWHLQMSSLFFQNFNVLACWGCKRVKNDPKGQKIMSVSLCILVAAPHVLLVFVTHL